MREALGADPPGLLERLRAGEPRAFEELVTAYQHRVFGVALRMLGSRAEAEESAQEVFLRAYRALADFRGGARLGTWLCGVAPGLWPNRLASPGRRLARGWGGCRAVRGCAGGVRCSRGRRAAAGRARGARRSPRGLRRLPARAGGLAAHGEARPRHRSRARAGGVRGPRARGRAARAGAEAAGAPPARAVADAATRRRRPVPDRRPGRPALPRLARAAAGRALSADHPGTGRPGADCGAARDRLLGHDRDPREHARGAAGTLAQARDGEEPRRATGAGRAARGDDGEGRITAARHGTGGAGRPARESRFLGARPGARRRTLLVAGRGRAR